MFVRQRYTIVMGPLIFKPEMHCLEITEELMYYVECPTI